jgi:hypothetical protein
MDACPDKLFIGVVKIFVFLELESRYSGKHFSKVWLLNLFLNTDEHRLSVGMNK